MIVSPQPHVSAPPSLADVLEAAKKGTGLIGRLEIIDTPTDPVKADAVQATHEELVEEAVETLTSAAELETTTEAGPEQDERAAAIQKNLDDLLPRLLAEIADLEQCVRRANEEAERAARHLEQARGLVAKVVAVADAVPRNAVLRLAVPGQRAEPGEGAAPHGPEHNGPSTRRGRW